MSTTIALLAYKEAENLRILLPNIKQIMDKMEETYEIIIVDSEKPTDDTEVVCKENNVTYIPQEEPHYGGAFLTAIKHARYDKLQILDADCSHDPIVIPKIHKKFDEGYDMVIGSRYVKGGMSNDSKSSFVMSKILNTTMRLCIGVRAKDISTSYRLYDTNQIKSVTLKRKNYDVLQEVILKMKLNKPKGAKFQIGEVPIIFNKRAFGESKRKLFKFICGYIGTLFILVGIRIKSIFVSRPS
jgi:dolichol-phosphate mannosyltransferase